MTARDRTANQRDLLILRHLNGEATAKDVQDYWQCSPQRVHQLINTMARTATGNYRERDGRLISAMTARNEMRRRTRTYYDPDTPEGFHRSGELADNIPPERY